MSIWRLEIEVTTGQKDVVGEGLLHDMRDLGITTVTKVKSSRLFLLETEATAGQVEQIARELLVDPSVETYRIDADEAPCEDNGQAGPLRARGRG